MTSLLKRWNGLALPTKVVDYHPTKVESFDQPSKDMTRFDHPPKKVRRFNWPPKKVK